MKNTDCKSIVDTIASECVGARIRILGRVVSGIYDDALRPVGLRVSQMNILVATAKFGVARQADICDALQMDHSTVSRNVDRMITRGWIETLPDADGRAAPFQVTKSGMQLLSQKAFPAWQEAQKAIVKLLGSDGVSSIRAATRRAKELAATQ